MILTGLEAVNFKNIGEARLELSPKANCFLGDNGMGKSNLLDAIYYLGIGKSFTGALDPMLIRRGDDFTMLRGTYLRKGIAEELTVGIRQGRRKSFRRGGKDYKRLSEHLGKFPLVLISPADMDLVTGPADERRRFMDMIIAQTDPRYLDMLIRYNRGLEQRNKMLKSGVTDRELFLAIEAGMEISAEYIAAARRDWTALLTGISGRYYRLISGTDEQAALAYTSHLLAPGTSLVDIFEQRRTRDAAVGYTTAGIHRDDIEMTLAAMPLRRTGSQGQIKTYTIALRLAQFEFIKKASAMTPLLLLDDIFDKLDAGRVGRIMDVVGSETFGQIFITDTNRKHLDELLARAGEYAMWHVAGGSFEKISETSR